MITHLQPTLLRLNAWLVVVLLAASCGRAPSHPNDTSDTERLKKQIHTMRANLEDASRDQLDAQRVFPLIVPRNYFAGGVWKAPYINLKHPELALTWVVLGEPDTMSYVSDSQAKAWEGRGINWRSIAMQNLASASAGRPVTQVSRQGSGEVAFAIMDHRDGLGSSRVLLPDQLASLFPNGYRVALPDRTVALAVALTASPDRLHEAQSITSRCFEEGATPMLRGLHEPNAFTPE